MAKSWYIIYMNNPTKSLGWIQTAFHKRGIEVVLWKPMQDVTKNIRGVNVQKPRPLFPSYVFAKFEYPGMSIDNELRDQKAGYVLKLVGSTAPAEVPEEEILRLKSLEKLKIDDRTPLPIIEKGSFIEITNGPFINMRGIVSSTVKDQVEIETFIMGRSTNVKISIHSVRKVKENIEAPELNDEIEGAVHEEEA